MADRDDPHHDPADDTTTKSTQKSVDASSKQQKVRFKFLLTIELLCYIFVAQMSSLLLRPLGWYLPYHMVPFISKTGPKRLD